MVKRSTILFAFAASACAGGHTFKIAIQDACNATAFDGNNVSFVELSVESPDLEAPVRATFDASGQAGSLDHITAVTQATIQIAGLSKASDGSAGSVVVAGSLGYLDLSGDKHSFTVMPGKIGTFLRTTQANDKTSACASQLSTRSFATASTLTDGRVLLAGGSNDSSTLASTEIYAPEQGTFGAGPDMRSARLAHTATPLIDGRVLIAGGLDASGKPVATLEVFKDNAFQRAVSMNGRAYHTATRMQDGRVLLAGGSDASGTLATTQIYDPHDEGVIDGPKLLSPRARHSAILVDDAVVALIGGIDDASVVAVVEFVDVDKGQSIAGPSLHTPRSDAAVGFLTSKRGIVVAGGYSDRVSDPARGTAIANIEVLQVADDVSATTVACSDASMVEPRAGAAIASVAHGFVVMGGVSSPGQVSATAEMLTFDAGPCRPTVLQAPGTMFASRFAAAVATLAGGDVLVTGGAGVSKGSVLSRDAAEIFIVPR